MSKTTNAILNSLGEAKMAEERRSSRRIVFSEQQLVELHVDRELFTCFMDALRNEPDATVITLIAVARSMVRQLSLPLA